MRNHTLEKANKHQNNLNYCALNKVIMRDSINNVLRNNYHFVKKCEQMGILLLIDIHLILYEVNTNQQ